MKAKVLFLLFALLTANTIYSFDIETDEYYVNIDITEGIVATSKELIHISEDYDDISIISRTARPKKMYNNYGFLEFSINKLHTNIVEMNGLFVTTIRGTGGHDPLIEEQKNNIKSLSSSGELIESVNGNTTIYNIWNVLSRLSYEKGTGFYIYRSGQPWAVDLIKDKKPIITIEVNTKISSFFILNGYVDFDKQSLFYNNARAKTIQILDKETNTIIGNYQLPDKVIYQLIYLPKAVKYFQIIIIDTYPGIKYSDLCISSIYLNTENEKVISGDYGISFLNELKKEKKS